MRNSRHLGLLAALAAVSMGPGLVAALGPVSRRSEANPRHRAKPVHNTTEIEAWNDAVEKRKAEKKDRKLKVTP